MKKSLVVIGAALLFSGCYHATVNTGQPPSGQTVEKQWAHSFLYGLVPPSTLHTASTCPSGVAMVETKQSFLNLLASGLTWGLYTPMTVTATCAAPGGTNEDASAFLIRKSEGVERAQEVFSEAAAASSVSGTPILVRFTD